MSCQAEHCWHLVEARLSIPPQTVQRCCWCGAKQTKESGDLREHGPYMISFVK